MNLQLDCHSGIAGDMLLGALLDQGLPLARLESFLKKVIPVRGWYLVSRPAERKGWPGRTFEVLGDRPFGSAKRMMSTVRAASMPTPVKSRALAVLQTLSASEAAAHHTKTPDFEPQGLGLMDTLIDVLGTSWAVWYLGVEEIRSSPVSIGRLSPAAAWIFQTHRIPLLRTDVAHELATPTGAAVLAHLNPIFHSSSPYRILKGGFGVGKNDFPSRPNVIGVFQVESMVASSPLQSDQVLLLETAMDDMDPRLYPHVADLLFAAGALDVWWTAVGMKKGRPGIALTVLGKPEAEARLRKILFSETTTLGIRRQVIDRWTLPRQEKGFYKVAQLPGGKTKRQVEFEVARARAHRTTEPLRKLLK